MVYVDRSEDCWKWQRGHDGRGYSVVTHDGKCRKVHRILYELYIGPIAKGMEIHHKCGNKGCVRPAHLQAVTRSEHMKITRAELGSVTHCIHGHAFDEANTYHYKGMRFCRACNKRRSAARNGTRRRK